MKLIKFRGRSIDNGEYVYGDFGYAATSGEPIIYFFDQTAQNWVGATVEEDSVAQLRWRDSKSHKEFYDGDFVGFSPQGAPLSIESALILVDSFGKVFHWDERVLQNNIDYFPFFAKNLYFKEE